jgi:Ca2+-binding EF-hand superfamily protein
VRFNCRSQTSFTLKLQSAFTLYNTNNDDNGVVDDENLLELLDTQGEETYRDVNVNDQLRL